NPEVAEQIRAQYADLAAWFDENAEALKDAASQVDKGVEDFAAIQQANQEIGQYKDVGLERDTLEILFPGYGKLSASKFEQPQLLQELAQADPQIRAASVGLLESLADVN